MTGQRESVAMLTVSEIKAQHVSEVNVLASLDHLQSHPGTLVLKTTQVPLIQGSKPQRLMLLILKVAATKEHRDLSFCLFFKTVFFCMALAALELTL